jgi:hypothetical protein
VGGTASYIGQGLFEAGVQLPLTVVESCSPKSQCALAALSQDAAKFILKFAT